MLKFATAQVMSKVLIPQNVGRRELRRIAHRHHFDYEVRPGYLYVRSRAISSRCNDNFDEFPAAELEKSYRSFIGKPVFVNHVNHDHKRARGVIIDAALHKDANRDGSPDYWVEVLMEVDAVRFPKLAQEILNGNIARTSMGCDVAYSICSACGNKATTPAEYCHHIPGAKGQRIYRHVGSGKKVGELIRETCYGLKFFENSLLVEPPADPTAHFLGVDTRGLDKAASKDPRFEGVGLKQDDDGWYVTTHRARSDSYESPEAIPQSVVNNIESTGAKTAAAAPGLSWDEIGERHPHVYGDPEIHGEEAEHADGNGIGWAAQHLAFDRPGNPDGENDMATVHDLTFHHVHVPVDSIDYQHHSGGDGRVESARRGYEKNPEQMPPPVLVHRHGVLQVADGHHRAQGAREAGLETIPAYVAKSPHPTTAFEDGEKAPYHGAEKVRWNALKAVKPTVAPTPSAPPSGPGWEQQKLFGSRSTLTAMFAQGGAQMDPKTASLSAEAAGPAYPNPADHPFYKDVPLSHEHVISHWEKATPEEKKQGARWYPDAHLVAKSIAKLNPDITDEKEAAHKGAGVLSAYSPQQGWWANQHNAARSFQEKRAIGKGEGIMVMASHATAAQKIMDGMDHQKALKGPKTQDFAHLIEHGGKDEKGNPSNRVVVDRHALSVAAGRRLSTEEASGFPSANRHYYEHAAQQYRTAAAVLSDREGRQIPPHEVQAVTWLVRQRLNSEESAGDRGQKGRDTVQRNQKKKWQDYSQGATPELHEDPKNSHVSKRTLTQLFAEAAKDVVPPFLGDPKLAVNQEGGEMPAFPWDKAPKINLPMMQKGWDEPQRKTEFDSYQQRKMQGPPPPTGTRMDELVDRLPDAGEQRLTDPHGIHTPDMGRNPVPEGKYPGDKREQWARHRWDNVKWPFWTDKATTPSSPEHILNSKKNIRRRWNKTWKKPLACEHDSCPPWAHGGDAMTPTQHDDPFKDLGFNFESSRKHAYGETKAPEDVDTLREDACPVCGDRDTYDGATCQVCGYVAPPKMFQDPDLELARQMDLRKDIAEFNGQPGQPVDPNSLDANGNPMNPDAADLNAQPGSLPGEVQAEVQPGGDVMDPNALGPDGQPIPDEMGAPVDPAMLGPDGMPLQQGQQQMTAPDGTPLDPTNQQMMPQQQMMLGPNGEPLGPQELPPDAVTQDGKPFTPGPNMPQGPGEPEGPEGPMGPEDLDEDGQVPNPEAGGGVPGTPGDGVPDLVCPACGFQADATPPVSVNMDTANMPPTGEATPDGVAAGDVCPNCQGALLISPAEAQGQVPAPIPA